MPSVGKQKKIRGNLIYVAGIFFLLAIAGYFLPIAGMKNAEGEIIPFESFLVFFGGEEYANLSSGNFSFYFQVNIPILITFQALVIAFFACLLGKNSMRNITIAGILVVLSFVSTFLFLKYILWINPGITEKGLVPMAGFYVGTACIVIGLALLVVECALCHNYWKDTKAFI